jgi:hypothetical protein
MGLRIVKTRDVLIGALVGGILVILVVDHGKPNPSAARASASVSARAAQSRAAHPRAAHPGASAPARRRSHPRASGLAPGRKVHPRISAPARRSHHAPPRKPAGSHPRAHASPAASPSAHLIKPPAASPAPGTGGGGWAIGLASIVAIAFSAAAVTITLRAGRGGTPTNRTG